MQFIVGKYFKVDPNRFYCIRGAKKIDGDDCLWLDIYNIVKGEAVLLVREPAYGYTPDAFKRYIEDGKILFQDKPFAPIKANKQVNTPARKQMETIQADIIPVKKNTKKQKPPPQITGSLF